MLTEAMIVEKFGYHAGTPDTIPKHEAVRHTFMAALRTLDSIVPDGRAKAVMITELETAAMWANKAVAELTPVVGE